MAEEPDDEGEEDGSETDDGDSSVYASAEEVDDVFGSGDEGKAPVFDEEVGETEGIAAEGGSDGDAEGDTDDAEDRTGGAGDDGGVVEEGDEDRDETHEERERRLDTKERELDEREEKVLGMREEVEEERGRLESLDESLREREERIQDREEELDDRETELDRRERELGRKEEELETVQERVETSTFTDRPRKAASVALAVSGALSVVFGLATVASVFGGVGLPVPVVSDLSSAVAGGVGAGALAGGAVMLIGAWTTYNGVRWYLSFLSSAVCAVVLPPVGLITMILVIVSEASFEGARQHSA